MLEAEALLLATGLVAAPDRTALAGAPGLVPDLKKEITAALDRDEPDRVFAVSTGGKGYAAQLAKEPDYEGFLAFLEPRIGHDDAMAYQVQHQTARQVLLSRRTIVTIDDGIMGVQVVANDPEADEQWALEVGQVEQMRIVKDLAAAALLKECVDVFRACFPETYRILCDHLDDELTRRRAKSKTWAPDPYIEDAIRIFLGLPWDAQVQIQTPAELPPGPSKGGGGGGGGKKKGSFDAEQLLTTGQKASQ